LLLSAGLIAKWQAERQHSKASDSWQRGVLALARGDLRGSAMAVKSARVESDRQLEALLIQARHFMQAGNRDALQQLREDASTNYPEHRQYLELSLARWQLQAGVFEYAKSLLAELPGSTEQAGLLLWSHIESNKWSAVSQHWAVAERRGVLKAEAFRAQMPLLRAGKAMADSVAATQQEEPVWRIGLKGLPKQWQADATTIRLFADMLLAQGKPQAARGLIQQVLSKHWHAELVRAYGEISSVVQLDGAIDQLHSRLAKKGEDPELLLALGRLSRAKGQHSQAHKYLVLAAKALGRAVKQPGSRLAESDELLQLITLELGRLNLTDSISMNASGAWS
jgi:uncharacterized protein HemY